MSSGPAGLIADSVEQLVAYWEALDRRAAIRAGQARLHALVCALGETQTAGDLNEEVRNCLREVQVTGQEVRALVVGRRIGPTGQRL